MDHIGYLPKIALFFIFATGQSFCNNAVWSNTSWSTNPIPGANYVNPPLKDTLIIPTGGYAVVQFKTDNPGE